MDKKQLRQQFLQKRDSLNLLDAQAKSHEITQRLLLLSEYQEAQDILVYLAFKNEISTKVIIIDAWQKNKRILIPVCQPSDKSLLLSELHSFGELTSGTWNIPEPKKEYLRPIDPQKVDLAIIPGLAFDFSGYRLGYGGGYYDRFLPKLLATCPKIALAYDFSLAEFLPHETHDIPVDCIVTETRTYLVK